MRNIFIIYLFAVCCFCACSFFEPPIVILWTDRPEFALYADYFNASQTRYKVETYYFEAVSQKLLSAKDECPDVVAGSWLKSGAVNKLFKPLDHFFRNEAIEQSAFYPKLLELGFIGDKQYLLPVSFNAPLMAFTRTHNTLMPNPFTITLEQTKALGKAYNVLQNGAYLKMGFSPEWNDEFLFVSAALFGSDFSEADPLSWNETALENALAYDKEWISEANTSIRAVEDFSFKYFFEPPARRAIQERILFTYMSSADFFTLDYDQQTALTFRWLIEQDRIPLIEGSVYYGLYRKSRSVKGASAFTKWFFQPETQRLILEKNKQTQLNAILFGVAGGFSALRNVTEDVFPRFYPNLLGHIPPDAYLSPPNILPQNWMSVKERVILPYMHEYIRAETEIRPLDRRITDWYRINK